MRKTKQQTEEPDSNSPLCGFNDRDNPLARILDLADDAIISIDREHRVILFNQGAEKMFGYSSSEVLSQSIDLLIPAPVSRIHRTHVEAFATGSVSSRRMGERREILGRRKSGAEFPAEASISKVEADGQIVFTAILRDVTLRTLADTQLKSSLREKEVLLKEVHHRVKNNLQVVSSLLGLQARSVNDPKLRKKFEESKDRIQSMALLHEHLYQSPDLARIDFARYIRDLAEGLMSSHGIHGRISLETDLNPIHVDMDTAVPCGLILNELLSNSLKYAFPDQRRGGIWIELCQISNDIRIRVQDDGIGLPAGFDITQSRSLGLRLVRMLVEQLRGAIALNGLAGTQVEISIPFVTS